MAITTPTLPAAGQRIGSVCGPCENPRDNAGTVLTLVTDRWGTHAVVLLDTGRTTTCHGLTQRGIGWCALVAAAK